MLLPGAPEPAEGNVQRKRQAREIVRKFSGRIVTSPRANIREQMRLLTTPLLEFADPRTKEYQGRVFGFHQWYPIPTCSCCEIAPKEKEFRPGTTASADDVCEATLALRTGRSGRLSG
jgi:hypothetical protein